MSAAGFRDILSLLGVWLGGVPSGPIFLAQSASQRDQAATFLVDTKFTIADHAGVGQPLTRAVEFSIGTQGGPTTWQAATPQTFDRHHTAIQPMAPAATDPPGTEYDFVWHAFFDLPEGNFPYVYLRVTVTDIASISAQVVIGPIFVTTLVAPPEDPFQRQLDRRAALARTPLDFLGNGLVVPFRRGSRDFVSATDVDLIKSSVSIILNTRAAVGDYPGDLPWRPDFGCKIWILRHRAINPTLRGQATAFVLEALRWEPRVRVTEVFVEREPFAPPNVLQVRVRYRIIEENVSDNRVLLPEFEETVSLAA